MYQLVISKGASCCVEIAVVIASRFGRDTDDIWTQAISP